MGQGKGVAKQVKLENTQIQSASMHQEMVKLKATAFCGDHVGRSFSIASQLGTFAERVFRPVKTSIDLAIQEASQAGLLPQVHHLREAQRVFLATSLDRKDLYDSGI